MRVGSEFVFIEQVLMNTVQTHVSWICPISCNSPYITIITTFGQDLY